MESLLKKLGYTEWLCKTNFSFLAGASHPHDIVEAALTQKYRGLCINDFDGIYGLARAHCNWERLKEEQESQNDLRLFYGAELHLTPDHEQPLLLQNTLCLVCLNLKGYQNLCHLISLAHHESKTEAVLPLKTLLENDVTGLAALQPMRGWIRHQSSFLFWPDLKDHFQDRFYFVLSRHRHPSEDSWIEPTWSLCQNLQTKFLISQDCFFHNASQKIVHDLVTTIRTNLTVPTATEFFFPNSERHLGSLKKIHTLYSGFPFYTKALEHSHDLADSIQFNLRELKYQYPKEMIPSGFTAQEYLEHMVWSEAKRRFQEKELQKIESLLRHEIKLIKALAFADYFLTVWDIVRWARSQNILCQGRGSAANSAICFVLGVTSVNPKDFDLLFERFMSLERGDPPDIDVDFEHERREEVIQYIYDRYGRHRAAMVANVITYRKRGALRAVGKAFGVGDDVLRVVSDLVGTPLFRSKKPEETLKHVKEHSPIDQKTLQEIPWSLWMNLAEQILNFPRHLGIHSGGFVLTDQKLTHFVAQEPATMENRTVIQWCKEDLEELGLFKIDVLSLGMLTAVRKSFELVKENYGRDLALYNIPANDPKTYAMIQRADTVGTFQIESRAQMSMLVRLQPKTFYDLVIEVAIVRPGPIQGKIIHPYLKRRNGLEPITYPDERLRPILKRTLGVSIFQEQAMRIAIAVGDFTAGEANELRKNIGVWNIKSFERNLDPWLIKLERGMRKNNLDQVTIEQILGQLKGFSNYGFPESHAISFALIAYASCYLKCHYPAAFFASVMNSQPMGFYAPHALIQAAKRDGVKILPFSVNHSGWDHRLEALPDQDQAFAIRLGFRLIDGLSQKGAETIEQNFQNKGPWTKLDPFLKDNSLYRDDVTALAAANVFESFGLTRAQALWEAEAVPFRPLIDENETDFPQQNESSLERMSRDFINFGTTLGNHPTEIIKNENWCYRVPLNHVVLSQNLNQKRDHSQVTVFGLVLTKQAPGSAKGMVFFTLEDESGFINLVFTPQKYAEFYGLIERRIFLLATGKLQKANGYHSVLVGRVEAPEVTLTVLKQSKARREVATPMDRGEGLFKAREYG